MRGWSLMPSKLSAQIAAFALLFFGTMIYWHWEAMLISYLSTRVISLPFDNIPELISDTNFRIILRVGTSFEDAFKTAKDEDWKIAWTDRVQPHLAEFTGFSSADLIKVLERDSNAALYENAKSIM